MNKTADNVPRKEKPRKTDVHTDRVVHRTSKADRFKTAVDIHNEISPYLNQTVSVRTVQRRLNEFKLMGRVARKKHLISEKNQRARLQFAKTHIKWTAEKWSKVVFTDESKLTDLVLMTNLM